MFIQHISPTTIHTKYSATNYPYTSYLLSSNPHQQYIHLRIYSQGGSITWRTTQNPTGHDYGHHMSKAAANMMSVLLSQELKSKGMMMMMMMMMMISCLESIILS